MTPVTRVDIVDDSEILSELSMQTHLTRPQLLMLYFSISGGIKTLDVLHLCAVSWRYPRIFGRGPYFPFSPEIIFFFFLVIDSIYCTLTISKARCKTFYIHYLEYFAGISVLCPVFSHLGVSIPALLVLAACKWKSLRRVVYLKNVFPVPSNQPGTELNLIGSL